ncbi:MAG: hypothetical protein QOE86_3676 [Solirubrobacteraceae bacterium]|nr:hypothetical protein [Solirubrobacteraceae bacterium]
MSGDLQAAIDELYRAPLAEFVAERKRLAAQLRAGGDRAAAAELAKLPKPSAAAWALNHVSREAPDTVGAWLAASVALRTAATNAREVGGEAIRAASTRQRAATAELLTLVRELARPNGKPPSEPVLDRVRGLLQVAAGDPAVAAALRAGRLTERELETDLSSLLPPSSSPAAPPSPAAPARDTAAEEAARARADLERRVGAAVAELDRRRSAVADRAHAAATADERLEDAHRTVHRRASEAGAAHEALADAERAAADAQAELERLRGQLR